MRTLLSLLFLSVIFNAQANVIQYFAGMSYSNPSELFKIKKDQLVFGSTNSYADLAFTGSVFNFNTFDYGSGEDHSRTFTLMPYGRIARRFDKKTVFSLDVTQPFNSNLNWGTDAFTRYANTQNFMTDVDVSPKMSYSVSKSLQIGGGLNANFLTNNEVNFAYPIGPTTFANLVNKTSSFGLGYNLGLTYLFDKSNFFGVTYYSKIRQETTGMSSLGTFFNENLALTFYMPATTLINYVHLFNSKWLLSLTGFQSEWSVNQYVRLYNTAVPAPRSNFVFDMLFDNSYAFLAVVRNQYTPKLGLTLAGMIDGGPEKNNLRTITFPSYTQYFVGLAGDYHFNPSTSLELMYGHVFSYPNIQNHVNINGTSIPFTTGKVNINVDVIDLKLKVEG